MSITQFVFVFLGGGLGSVCRYAIGHMCSLKNGFPIGTFIANILACFILGAFLGYQLNNPLSSQMRLLLLVGFCGGFSTFSTFSSETLKLLQNQHYVMAGSYIILSLVLGVLSIWIGIFMMQRFSQ